LLLVAAAVAVMLAPATMQFNRTEVSYRTDCDLKGREA
jgi:hypothetical protein